ncbi:DUF2911 domain-containing protein [Ferruginibacter paludis]|uniref:DUF2911 domain-containing protein n=1 Tax=Ferruginibacter paludis TaxID=1310417 RepID=UPI0025B51476|nr:DUF2911 domain-containing protein [Ferruginibacter paludis]MDN3659297.1 DUF2911 domain-containing protein [Ferruginibacter paludis]
MKKIVIFAIAVCCLNTALQAQSKFAPVDKSPMDMAYYPSGYPVLKIQDKATEPVAVRVIYSRPQKNGRVIFGDLIPFGQVWRLGANEATEIEFYRPARIGTAKIKKGRYTLYSIPNQDKWTIILNRETDTWGSFKYDASKDVARIDLPVQKQSDVLESFSMSFDKSAAGVILSMGWDDSRVDLPIGF